MPSFMGRYGKWGYENYLSALMLCPEQFRKCFALGEEDGLEENIAWGKRLNETAVDMAGGVWMSPVGIIPEDEEDPKWDRFADSVGQIAAHAEGVGAVLTVETGPEPPAVVRRMIEHVNSPALRVNYDPANLLLRPGS
jgi:sugar phosphate isomerase/epimerase